MKRKKNTSFLKIKKRQLVNVSLTLFFISLFLISILPTATAATDDATFDSIDVFAFPPVQGMGGEIKIEVSANFFGGCCYYLYAKDVKATISEPGKETILQNVQVLSSISQFVGTVDAEPGGKATTVKFHWTITSEVPGTYNIEVKVSTSNCGTESSVIQVTFVEGASISPLKIFPSKPSIKESITFSAVVKSGFDFIDIEQTSLYIWHSNKDYSELSLIAEQDRLHEIVGGIESNITSLDNENITKQFLGYGEAYEMKHVELTETWRLQLSEFKKEENVYYWFNVETSDGKNSTSFVYKQEIEDYEKKYQMLNYVKYSTFLTILIGIILILGISWKYSDRPAKGFDRVGIFILGSKFFSKPSEGKRKNIPELSVANLRTALIIIFFIIALIMIIISVYLGLYNDLITETGG